MDRHLIPALTLTMVLALTRPAVQVRTTAAPDQAPAAPAETGVYIEDFATYTAEDYTENAE
jgi:hypothetical protein